MKPIVVFYVNISNVPPSQIDAYIDGVKDTVKDTEKEYISFIVPVREQDTRIECINPVMVSAEEYKKVKAQLETIDQMFKTPVFMIK